MIDSELQLLKQSYLSLSMEITNVNFHYESKEYNACSFQLGKTKIIFRKSKITPKKVGQFVTFWKRSKLGPIEPYHEHDDFDFFVVKCALENTNGQFIFPKSILLQKGIISSKSKEGKRAFRVYPIWEKTNNKQAEKTQSWQKDYFIVFDNTLNDDKVRKMYAI